MYYTLLKDSRWTVKMKKVGGRQIFISFHAQVSTLGKVFKELSQFLQTRCKGRKLCTWEQICAIKLCPKSESIQYNAGLLWNWDILGTPRGWGDEKEWLTTKMASDFRQSRLLRHLRLLAHRENQGKDPYSWNPTCKATTWVCLSGYRLSALTSAHMMFNQFKEDSLVPKHGWSKSG